MTWKRPWAAACLAAGCLAIVIALTPHVAAPQAVTETETNIEPEPVPLRIAILDIQRVIQNAAAVKALQSRMREYVEAYRSETEKEEEEIRAAQQELASKRDAISPEQYEAERRMLEQRLIEAQATVQQRKQTLDQTQQQGMDQVQSALNAVVTEIANEEGLTLILRKDQTVLNATALEITDEVLSRLNERLPTAAVAGASKP